MNGLIFNGVVRSPLKNPHSIPVTIPIATPDNIGAPFSIAIVPSNPPIARIDPTDKSIPPTIMTIVIPIAMIAIKAIWLAIFSRFLSFKNVGA